MMVVFKCEFFYLLICLSELGEAQNKRDEQLWLELIQGDLRMGTIAGVFVDLYQVRYFL